MSYVRKTKDVYFIETNYGYGWESENEYSTYAEAKADYKEYCINVNRYGGDCRIKKRRERI